MFDVKAPRPVYDKLNSVISQQNMIFYLSASAVHVTSMAYLSFFFRYRRLSLLSTVAVGTAYYAYFEAMNNMLYKLIVDKNVIDTARRFGFDAQV